MRVSILIPLIAPFALGCSPSEKPTVAAPILHPVTGKVVTPNGRPLTGGVVEFRQADSTVQSFTTIGTIKNDGTFTLHTMVNDEQVSGATAGAYRVIVVPPLGDQVNPAEGHIDPFVLPKLYTIHADRENKFTITVPGMRK